MTKVTYNCIWSCHYIDCVDLLIQFNLLYVFNYFSPMIIVLILLYWIHNRRREEKSFFFFCFNLFQIYNFITCKWIVIYIVCIRECNNVNIPFNKFSLFYFFELIIIITLLSDDFGERTNGIKQLEIRQKNYSIKVLNLPDNELISCFLCLNWFVSKFDCDFFVHNFI